MQNNHYETPTTSELLLALHDRLTSEARELMTRKNADYKGGSGDPFANFRMSALLKLDPATGVLLRMQDKMARVMAFLERGDLKVKSESCIDIGHDLINYSVILTGLLIERMNETRNKTVVVFKEIDGIGQFPVEEQSAEKAEALHGILQMVNDRISKIMNVPENQEEVKTIEDAITALTAIKHWGETKMRCKSGDDNKAE